jgi:predicted permease
VVIAWGLVSLAAAFLPREFIENSLNPLDLDLRALLAGAVAGFVATTCAGLLPALLATRVDGASTTQSSQRQGTQTGTERLAVRGLLVLQVSLSCALLIGAALLVRSFVNASRIDRGFDPRGLVEVTWTFDGTNIRSPEARAAVSSVLRDEALRLPGVGEATWSQSAGTVFGDITSDLAGAAPVTTPIQVTAIDSSYFDVYRTSLVQGRVFRPDDGENVAIVGESLAARFWPGTQAVGRTLNWSNSPFRVIGVVREPRQSLIDTDREFPDVFVPFGNPGRYPVLTVRCANGCPPEGAFRRAFQNVSQGGVADARYLDDAFLRDLEQPSSSAWLGSTFALIALATAALGLFGSLTYSVQERRREFGVRAALGATPTAIAKVVCLEAAIVAGLGLAVGAVVASAVARSLATIIFDVQPFDPTTWSVVLATLAAAIALAAWRPARLAARTDPALLMRDEG